MNLTPRLALELSYALWAWLAETGAEWKSEWPEWEWNGGMIPWVMSGCFLCEQTFTCEKCLLFGIWGRGCNTCDVCGSPYRIWEKKRTRQFAAKVCDLMKSELKARGWWLEGYEGE